MATGYTVIFVTPAVSVLSIPDDWTPDFESDLFPERIKYDDRLILFDHDPTPEEIAAEIGPGEFQAELRQPPDDPLRWRLRVRYPIAYTTETRGANLNQLYTLSDARLPLAWGRKAIFWRVWSTAAKLKVLHEHIYTTLGFGPIAGALAALDPANTTRFLANAVQTATGLSDDQQRARVKAMRDRLLLLDYAAAAMTAIVDAPAGKTENDLILAIVSDLGFEMAQLFKTMMRLE